MKNVIYIDTSALIALLNKSEPLHKQTGEVLMELTKEGVFLVTTDYVLDELLTFMRCSQKESIDRVISFMKRFELSKIELFGITQDIFGEALGIMKKYKDHYFSCTDCVSFAVMKHFKTNKVLTTDKHFEIAGFKNLLLS